MTMKMPADPKDLIDEAELRVSFEEAVTRMKRLVREAVLQGQGYLVSPVAMMVMRRVPNIPGMEVKPLDKTADGSAKVVALLSPTSFTPPGRPLISPGQFWNILKMMVRLTEAYGIVIGMESWVLLSSDLSPGEKIPHSIADHPKRREGIVVSTERSGERKLFQAAIQRDGNGGLTIEDWACSEMDADGRIFGAFPSMTPPTPPATA